MKATLRRMRFARRRRGALMLAELDTYKQLIQPNIHAGSSLFWGFPNTLKPRGIYDQKRGHFYRLH
jgi:hypothetical protein